MKGRDANPWERAADALNALEDAGCHIQFGDFGGLVRGRYQCKPGAYAWNKADHTKVVWSSRKKRWIVERTRTT